MKCPARIQVLAAAFEVPGERLAQSLKEANPGFQHRLLELLVQLACVRKDGSGRVGVPDRRRQLPRGDLRLDPVAIAA